MAAVVGMVVVVGSIVAAVASVVVAIVAVDIAGWGLVVPRWYFLHLDRTSFMAAEGNRHRP